MKTPELKENKFFTRKYLLFEILKWKNSQQQNDKDLFSFFGSFLCSACQYFCMYRARVTFPGELIQKMKFRNS